MDLSRPVRPRLTMRQNKPNRLHPNIVQTKCQTFSDTQTFQEKLNIPASHKLWNEFTPVLCEHFDTTPIKTFKTDKHNQKKFENCTTAELHNTDRMVGSPLQTTSATFFHMLLPNLCSTGPHRRQNLRLSSGSRQTP